MAQARQWHVVVDEKEYDVIFRPAQWSGKHTLTVNGTQIPFPYIGLRGFVGWEVPVPLGEKTALLAARGRRMELVVDGICVENGDSYTPLLTMRWWGYLFVALSLGAIFVPISGLLPYAAGLAGAVFSARAATSPKLKAWQRVLACFGITAAAWLAVLLLFFRVFPI